jgi:NEDD4-binding protein 2
MRKLKIMRGVSGSGKSTKSREIVRQFEEENPEGKTIICSADGFFIDSRTGKYVFDAKKLGQAHAWCKGQVYAAMKLGVDLILVDNTNTQKWEYQPYLDMAYAFKYDTEEIIVGSLDDDSLLEYAERNEHGVPLEAIQRMANRFEKE